MKIRTRFTLLIACAVFVAAGLVYLYVMNGLLEERYRQIDQELLDIGSCLLEKASTGSTVSEQTVDFPLSRYWILLKKSSGGTLYRSQLSTLAELPENEPGTYSFALAETPLNELWIEAEEEDERSDLGNPVRFRVLSMRKDIGDQHLLLNIGKPIPLLMLELKELSFELLLLVGLFVGAVFAVSYTIAGKLLQPLDNINRLTRKIRESSLDQRIPLGKSKDELYVLSASLNSMFDRLESSFRKQKEFVSNASHELKSPLTILRLGYEDILDEETPENLRRELQKQLTTIQRMQKLIHDLLDISRLEQADALNREQIDLGHIIREVIREYAEVLDSRHIQLKVSPGQWPLFADPEMLRRLFVNLIDNAIKYNKNNNGRIIVDINENSEELKISMTNTGTPLPPKEHASVFEQFYRVEKSRSSHYGGTGLGLTIARRIVEMHDGVIRADSDSRFTTFTIILPRDHKSS